jgi:lysozyme family protein
MDKTFHWEGGVANDPVDRGGLTNMGVTRPFLSQFLGRPATDADLLNLTKDTALGAYFKNVWQGFGIPDYPDFLRLEMFNCFTGSTWLGVQCAKRLQSMAGLVADGQIGPASKAKFREMDGWADERKRTFNREFVKAIIEELIGICQRDPSQIRFMLGWFRRYSEFLDTVNDPTTAPI